MGKGRPAKDGLINFLKKYHVKGIFYSTANDIFAM
jgi:hypothetical protein